MPELPEVETACQGIRPHLLEQKITEVLIHRADLRWPIAAEIKQLLPGHRIFAVKRRGKYILIASKPGVLILHLGMSGSLRIMPQQQPRQAHEHFELVLQNQQTLRLRDPRRFGAVLWGGAEPLQHPLLANLGPEPLSDDFNADNLFLITRKRTRTIRDLLIDSHIVAGLGNIYANEALFQAGIRPQRAAGKISKKRYTVLTKAIKQTLQRAIKAGGTTLRDFSQSDGNPGYFRQKLQVYGRTGLPCRQCQRPIRQQKMHGRSIFYCPECQR